MVKTMEIFMTAAARQMQFVFSLSAARRGAVKVLLCEAFIVRPKDVVLAFAICCVSRNRKCFASRGIDRSFKRCSFGFCYLVRFAGP